MYIKYKYIKSSVGKFITEPPNNTKLNRYSTLKMPCYVTITYMCVRMCVIHSYIFI